MGRREEDLPPGATPTFDFDRGQEVVHADESGRVKTWRAPYCGKQSLTMPQFRATKEELNEVERQILARCPAGTTVTVLNCGPSADEDGARERTAHAAIEHSPPTLAGD